MAVRPFYRLLGGYKRPLIATFFSFLWTGLIVHPRYILMLYIVILGLLKGEGGLILNEVGRTLCSIWSWLFFGLVVGLYKKYRIWKCKNTKKDEGTKKDIAGKSAKHIEEINPYLKRWLRKNRIGIKVIDYYIEDGRWVPYKVEYIEEYSPGMEDKGGRLTDGRYQLSDEEQRILNGTLQSYKYDEIGKPIRFRIVLDETTVARRGDMDHSSFVHVGERMATVWFAEGLFRDLFSRNKDPLRDEIFSHEKQHLLGNHSIDEEVGYQYLVERVYERCKEIEQKSVSIEKEKMGSNDEKGTRAKEVDKKAVTEAIEDNVYSFSQKVDALINESVGRINTILDLDGKDKMIQVGRLILERLDIRGDASDMALSMAWHVRDGLNCHLKKKLGMDEEFKGKVIYSLSALLNGALNGKEQERLKRFAEKTRGRVFFYVGKGFSPHEGHKYLEEKDHVVNKENLGMKIAKGELVVFMLSKEELEDLGIKDGSLPKWVEMKTDWAKEGFKAFIIPIKEKGRNVSNDISLGLELIRSRGEPEDLPDLFKSLLIIYLKEAGYSREDIERLCGEGPISACDYKDMIEESYNKVDEIINSA